MAATSAERRSTLTATVMASRGHMGNGDGWFLCPAGDSTGEYYQIGSAVAARGANDPPGVISIFAVWEGAIAGLLAMGGHHTHDSGANASFSLKGKHCQNPLRAEAKLGLVIEYQDDGARRSRAANAIAVVALQTG
eukprot:CAMPEP_0197435794 /NCGR_PEP_ID=MMETSP1175-20131217/3310_1 /TAXON_ID=1003142 /ORGANISM="Triceratium dubium, Strain CCMP147" /LENGTH=135 /DNA_ID=CAMNT_0042964909 /DNA_START=651 /DNA_END=1060 /DNA_ORIENTATION=+